MNDNVPPFGGHSGCVFAVAVTPDGRSVVSGGDDGILRLWDLRTGHLKQTFRGHEEAVTCLALAPDGVIALTGSTDRTIGVWDLQGGQVLAFLSGHSSGITSVAVSSDGRHAASAGFDGTVRIWALPSGEEEAVLHVRTPTDSGVGAVAFAPDDHRLVLMPFDGTGQVWDWRTGRQLVSLAARAHMFGNFILRPDQALIGTIAVTSDGKQVVACGITQFGEPGRNDDLVDRFRSRRSGAVGIFSLDTGALDTLSQDIPGQVVAAIPTVDGEHVITADSKLAIRIWNRRTGQMETTFGEMKSEKSDNGHKAFINALAVTVGGDYIITGSDDGTIRVWERATGEVKAVITSHLGGRICAVACTLDGEQVVTGGYDGTVRMWNLASGELAATFEGHRGWVTSVDVSSDGRYIVSGSFDGTIRFWDRTTGDLAITLAGPKKGVAALATSRDSDEVATVHYDNVVRLWNPSSGIPLTIADRLDTDEAIAYAPSGRDIVIGNHDRILVYNLLSRETRSIRTEGNWIRRLAVSPDGTNVAVTHNGGEIELYDLATGRHEASFRSDGMAANVAISSDGTEILGTSYNGPLRLYSRRTGEVVREFVGHLGPVPAAIFGPDGEEIISVGFDGAIRVWNRARGVQVRGSGYLRKRPETLLAAPSSDEPTSDDRLGLGGETDALASLIAASSTRPPLSIAILGDWGAGKSSFMLQIEERVARFAAQSKKNADRTAYLSNVLQIRFNAWSYSDESVWTGLIERLFQELYAAVSPSPANEADFPRQRAVIAEELARAESEYKSLNEILYSLATRHVSRSETPYSSDLDAARIFKLVWSSDRRYFPALLAFLAIMIFLWVRFGLSPASVVATVGLIAVPVIQIARTTKSVIHGTVDYGVAKQKELENRRTRLQTNITELTDELARVDAAARLAEFLRERISADRYAQYRGIVGEVHKDLSNLDRHLSDAYQEWRTNGSQGPPPLRRVVLYIDDLDRCRPERVVETLEAVHLFLALPLFIVVVGVDARWLLRSIQHHHSSLFGALDAGGSDSRQQAEVTLDYLDKIFQIPYALRPMGQYSEHYMRQLLEPAAGANDQFDEMVEEQPQGEHNVADESDRGYEGLDVEPPQAPVTSMREQSFRDEGSASGDDESAFAFDLNPPGLRLRTSEVDFISRLGPTLPSPRAAKKFLNLYRLIRIGIPEGQLASFIGGSAGGPYQIVLVLLALVVGKPTSAAAVLMAIREENTPEANIEMLLHSLASDDNDSAAAVYLHQFADVIDQIHHEGALYSRLDDYKTWLPVVARLSFFTHTL